MNVQNLIQEAKEAVDYFIRSLGHIPADKRDWQPQSGVKSASDIARHVSYWNAVFAHSLAGQASLDLEETAWLELQMQTDTLALSQSMAQLFLEAIDSLSNEDLQKEVEMPWGTRRIWQPILTNIQHIYYHIGQFSYIQTMLGDQEDYWG